MKNIKLKKISLDEIANYSAWPPRLFSLDYFADRHKNSTEVNREFGDEKWGRLLKSFKDEPILKIDDIEAAEQDLEQEIPCFDSSLGLYLVRAKDAQRQQMKIYEKVLSKYADEAHGLVELGAGYGSKIIRLANLNVMKELPLFAGEYTQSGCDLISLLAKKTKKNIQVGRCDFDKLDLSGLDIPENSIIFTSYSVHYVSELKEGFVDFLYQFKPKVVVHFEPCYEYFDTRSLHGLMCKRYMELNGYTENIASAIDFGCQRIGARVQLQKNVFGCNPFLPFSVIEWSPQY